MITAATAILPIAPGLPVRGASPAGSDPSFAASMMAAAGATDAAPAAAARQALAVPGTPLPTSDAAAPSDPTRAWLAAVDIATPASLDPAAAVGPIANAQRKLGDIPAILVVDPATPVPVPVPVATPTPAAPSAADTGPIPVLPADPDLPIILVDPAAVQLPDVDLPLPAHRGSGAAPVVVALAPPEPDMPQTAFDDRLARPGAGADDDMPASDGRAPDDAIADDAGTGGTSPPQSDLSAAVIATPPPALPATAMPAATAAPSGDETSPGRPRGIDAARPAATGMAVPLTATRSNHRESPVAASLAGSTPAADGEPIADVSPVLASARPVAAAGAAVALPVADASPPSAGAMADRRHPARAVQPRTIDPVASPAVSPSPASTAADHATVPPVTTDALATTAEPATNRGDGAPMRFPAAARAPASVPAAPAPDMAAAGRPAGAPAFAVPGRDRSPGATAGPQPGATPRSATATPAADGTDGAAEEDEGGAGPTLVAEPSTAITPSLPSAGANASPPVTPFAAIPPLAARMPDALAPAPRSETVSSRTAPIPSTVDAPPVASVMPLAPDLDDPRTTPIVPHDPIAAPFVDVQSAAGSVAGAADQRGPVAPTPGAQGPVLPPAAAAAGGIPVIAAAAAVAVAGAPVLAAPPPPGTTPAQPGFVREVARASRQTVALAPQAATPQPAAGTTAPAAQVFGAAMHAARGNDDRRSAERAEPAEPALTATVAPAAAALAAPSTAVADAGAPALDMRQNTWPATMIDHIEALRDAANANDTRIRLVPDALGTIDIAVRTVGSSLHVRFSAEDAATRTLIEDARPRLAAIAEERGLRIGQTIVDAGIPAAAAAQTAQNPGQGQSQAQSGQASTGQSASGQGQSQTAAQAQSGQQQGRQPQQSQPARRPPPARATSNDSDAGGNGRIA